jgi:hypothetical protein
MLPYLVNATMIWLLSLLAFDLLLRRESYHSYNRLYLLFTFAMGILLPLWQWDAGNEVYQTISNTNTYTGIVNTKQNIVAVATPTQVEMSLTQWLWLAYLAGVIAFTLLLVKEILILIRFNRNGKKSKDGVWNIIETGKKHSPFSAFRYIYISSKDDYSAEELRIILTHEELHGHALHFIDTLLLHAAKIIFWFHPLVYLYHRRLLMLHEYQADAAASEKPLEYGHFLVQQALLHPAPTLSHSFNRSPIKNRILMLTRKSSFMAGFKRLAILPLCIVCIFLFTENALSKEARKEGSKLYYKGNVFELWSPTATPDTIMVEDPTNGEIAMVISTIDSFPVRMNGRDIFRVGDFSNMERKEYDETTAVELREYFAENMKTVMNKMQDGEYRIHTYLILDESGKVVYYNPVHISLKQGRMDNLSDAEQAQAKIVEGELEKIIHNTTKKFTPVKRASKPVIMRIEELFSNGLYFRVTNHKTVY